MNKELKVLYTIFELEMAPPFRFFEDSYDIDTPWIYNKRSEWIGCYVKQHKYFYTDFEKIKPCLDKIKKTFNLDMMSDEDMYLITKYLVNWFRDKFPKKIEGGAIKNDTGNYIEYWINKFEI